MGWTELLDKNDEVIGIVGDKGWDLAMEFVEKLQELYKKEFGRPATIEETKSTIAFVFKNTTEWVFDWDKK